MTYVSPPSRYYKPKTDHADRDGGNRWGDGLTEGLKERHKCYCRVLVVTWLHLQQKQRGQAMDPTAQSHYAPCLSLRPQQK